jgi:hypothetical protein
VLDALLAKNMITVEQYADQVRGLTASSRRRPDQRRAAVHAGADVSGCIRRAAGRERRGCVRWRGRGRGRNRGREVARRRSLDMGDSAKQARERMVELNDRYTELTNAAQKFTDSWP